MSDAEQLREQLLALCEQSGAPVSIIVQALVEALGRVIVESAPSADEARSAIDGFVRHLQDGVADVLRDDRH